MERTLRLARAIEREGPETAVTTTGVSVVSTAATHAGAVRSVNEDSFLDRPELGLWVVADGVGGSFEGQAASRLVVDFLATIPPPVNASALMVEVRARLDEAHRQLSPLSSATTVVALLFYAEHYACVWAGDSRLYLLRDGELRRLTKDHSEVQSLVDAGLLSEEEAQTHPRANVITRAIGSQGELDLDMIHAPVTRGDTFLLCSDGLTKTLADDEIKTALTHNDLSEIADGFVSSALARGAPDNVTVVLVRFSAVT